jgi:DNA repair exonuclease SbcCD nuclease subunit
MKFIHTADWQIGMKAVHIGAAGDRVRNERLETARRVVKAAEETKAEFILLAGDTFEDNGVDRVLVQKVVDILGKFSGVVYLIPGNHDPLVPGSVWEHPAWASYRNLYVLGKAEPIRVPGGILYPCPTYEKRSNHNPVQWIKSDHPESITIGIAHGTVEGIQQEEPEYPISRAAPALTGLDYLALGHWHSTTTYADSAGVIHMAYSGTPEPTKFGERDSGNVLLVEIPEPRQPPVLTSIRTGRLSWQVVEQDLRQSGDLARVRELVENIEDPSLTLLEVRMTGVLWAEECHELTRIREIVQSRCLSGRVDDSCVISSPEDESWAAGLPAGSLRDAALCLCELANPSFTGERPVGASPNVASRALLELYALVAEVPK